MKKFLSVLITAAFAAFVVSAMAADPVQSGGKTTETQGRALDEVKAGGKTTDTQGRAVDSEKKKSKKKAKKKAEKPQQ